MFEYIKQLTKLNEIKEVIEGYNNIKDRLKKETEDTWKCKAEGFIDHYAYTISELFIDSLEIGHPIPITYFCKLFDMNEEDTAKVNKLVKERLMNKKLKEIQEDF